mmetsp:Transcript_45536/g.113922  ORF Transcript_45536/g.113922 Transcript_45536/m.113922 type:complete len:294 (+) Transcript_45536:370-1251(+)
MRILNISSVRTASSRLACPDCAILSGCSSMMAILKLRLTSLASQVYPNARKICATSVNASTRLRRFLTCSRMEARAASLLARTRSCCVHSAVRSWMRASIASSLALRMLALADSPLGGAPAEKLYEPVKVAAAGVGFMPGTPPDTSELRRWNSGRGGGAAACGRSAPAARRAPCFDSGPQVAVLMRRMLSEMASCGTPATEGSSCASSVANSGATCAPDCAETSKNWQPFCRAHVSPSSRGTYLLRRSALVAATIMMESRPPYCMASSRHLSSASKLSRLVQSYTSTAPWASL